MNARLRQAAITIVSLVLVYAAAIIIGFGLLVAAFQVGLLGRIDILFYRGLILIALTFVGTFGLLALALGRLRPTRLGSRDAFAAAVLSLSLNLSFLVVVPVTVDRSISIFILGQMAAQPDATFTPDAMTERFMRVYVTDHRQIDRRLYEQAVSGNVEKEGDGYRISARGRLVVAAARLVVVMFDSHAGILAEVPARVSSRDPR